MYQWSLHNIPHWGWIITLMFSAAMSMRLARFNTMLDDSAVPEYWSHYFVGVPAPMAAAIGVMPLLIWFDFDEIEFILRNPYFVGFLMLLVAFLMVSRIPTLSVKKTKIKSDWVVPLMILFALVVSCLITKPWLTLGIFTICYILTIPITIWCFLQDKKAAEKEIAEE
jgi:CDP-diacylglycerol--serine O-phosphatidyltransferase